MSYAWPGSGSPVPFPSHHHPARKRCWVPTLPIYRENSPIPHLPRRPSEAKQLTELSLQHLTHSGWHSKGAQNSVVISYRSIPQSHLSLPVPLWPHAIIWPEIRMRAPRDAYIRTECYMLVLSSTAATWIVTHMLEELDVLFSQKLLWVKWKRSLASREKRASYTRPRPCSSA